MYKFQQYSVKVQPSFWDMKVQFDSQVSSKGTEQLIRVVIETTGYNKILLIIFYAVFLSSPLKFW